MKKQTFILLSLGLILAFASCNPDCETITSANIEVVSADVVVADQENEILLRSAPPEFLRRRKVYIQQPFLGTEFMEVPTRFVDELNGLIAELPEIGVGNSNIFIDDPDCSGNMILVDPLQVRSEEFFLYNDVFIVPPIPLVIIPIAAVVPPINITNAWVAPYDRTYCIWFVPWKDDDGNELNDLRAWEPGNEAQEIIQFGMKGSHEFVVCREEGREHRANGNPVSGIVDKENNFIEITVDRTRKGLGTEVFTGMFIEPNSIPVNDDWRNGGGCAPNENRKEEFMLLTSQSTGQQLMMVKAN